MELLFKILLYIHLFGFAAVTGGLLTQFKLKNREVTSLAVNGARLQVITGVLLWLTAEAGEFSEAGLGLKLVGALIILGVLETRRKKGLPKNLYYFLLIVLALQVVTAVFLLEIS